MPISLFSVALLATALTAHASEVDQAAKAIAGMQASFTQRFTPKGFKNSHIEGGSVVFGDLPKMRWTYDRPEEKVFIFDGNHSWFYVPGDKQVTVATVDDNRKAELPFLLIGDPQARERLFEVTEASREGAIVVSLQPRQQMAAIRTVTLTITAATHLIQQLEYADREGNRTVFDFSGYQRRDAPPDFFHFTPPAGVEVINAP